MIRSTTQLTLNSDGDLMDVREHKDNDKWMELVINGQAFGLRKNEADELIDAINAIAGN